MCPGLKTLSGELEKNLRQLLGADEQENFVGGIGPAGEILPAENLGEWRSVFEECAQVLNTLGELSHEFRRLKQDRIPGAVDFSDEYLEHFAERDSVGPIELFLAWVIRERGRSEERIDWMELVEAMQADPMCNYEYLEVREEPFDSESDVDFEKTELHRALEGWVALTCSVIPADFREEITAWSARSRESLIETFEELEADKHSDDPNACKCPYCGSWEECQHWRAFDMGEYVYVPHDKEPQEYEIAVIHTLIEDPGRIRELAKSSSGDEVSRACKDLLARYEGWKLEYGLDEEGMDLDYVGEEAALKMYLDLCTTGVTALEPVSGSMTSGWGGAYFAEEESLQEARATLKVIARALDLTQGG